MKIAIIGYGIVGQATENTLKAKYLKDIVIHDPSKGNIGSYLDADLIFLCVPTDTVKAYFNDIPQEKHHDVIIRSTFDFVLLGDEFMSVGVWPEFLTDRTWVEDSRKPICNILGGTLKQLEVLNEITIFDNFYHTTPKIAAMMKVATNSFYTMKVTFANVLKEIAGNDYAELQKCLLKDNRMAADVHFQVPGPDGNYGYGGKCFPNNLEIFKKFSNDANFFASTIEILNRKYRGKE